MNGTLFNNIIINIFHQNISHQAGRLSPWLLPIILHFSSNTAGMFTESYTNAVPSYGYCTFSKPKFAYHLQNLQDWWHRLQVFRIYCERKRRFFTRLWSLNCSFHRYYLVSCHNNLKFVTENRLLAEIVWFV